MLDWWIINHTHQEGNGKDGALPFSFVILVFISKEHLHLWKECNSLKVINVYIFSSKYFEYFFFSNRSISVLYQSSCWVFPGAQIYLVKSLPVSKAWCYDLAFMGNECTGGAMLNSQRPGSFNGPECGVKPFHPWIEGGWKNDACWGHAYAWHL